MGGVSKAYRGRWVRADHFRNDPASKFVILRTIPVYVTADAKLGIRMPSSTPSGVAHRMTCITGGWRLPHEWVLVHAHL